MLKKETKSKRNGTKPARFPQPAKCAACGLPGSRTNRSGPNTVPQGTTKTAGCSPAGFPKGLGGLLAVYDFSFRGVPGIHCSASSGKESGKEKTQTLRRLVRLSHPPGSRGLFLTPGESFFGGSFFHDHKKSKKTTALRSRLALLRFWTKWLVCILTGRKSID